MIYFRTAQRTKWKKCTQHGALYCIYCWL